MCIRDRHEQRSLAYFKHGIELAEVLGCDRMSINSGWGDWDEDREEAWKRSREHLSILAEYAGEHGLVLTMESLRPEESNLVTTVSDAKRMIDELSLIHIYIRLHMLAQFGHPECFSYRRLQRGGLS